MRERERERERERGRENEKAPRFAPSSSGRVPPSTETGVHRGRIAFSPPTLWEVPPPPETGVHRGRLAFSPPTLWGVPPPPETGFHRGHLASSPPALLGVPPPPETGVHRGHLVCPTHRRKASQQSFQALSGGRFLGTPRNQVFTVSTCFRKVPCHGPPATTPTAHRENSFKSATNCFGRYTAGDFPKAGAHGEHLLSGGPQELTPRRSLE